MIPLLYFVYLKDLGYHKVEAVLALPDHARAVKLRDDLGYGRVRKGRIHVCMRDLPHFLEQCGAPEPFLAAAYRLGETLRPGGEPLDTEARDSAIRELAASYQEAIRNLGPSADRNE